MNTTEIIKGNEQIHIYMGWEYMTPEEIMDYSISPTSVIRKSIHPTEYAKRKNLPNMKKNGSVITTLSHNDICYSDILNYDDSLDAMFPVLEKLSNEYYQNNDSLKTMEQLLHGVHNDVLPLTKENLWSRLVKLVTIINKGI